MESTYQRVRRFLSRYQAVLEHPESYRLYVSLPYACKGDAPDSYTRSHYDRSVSMYEVVIYTMI